jgi:hypothetical protein
MLFIQGSGLTINCTPCNIVKGKRGGVEWEANWATSEAGTEWSVNHKQQQQQQRR